MNVLRSKYKSNNWLTTELIWFFPYPVITLTPQATFAKILSLIPIWPLLHPVFRPKMNLIHQPLKSSSFLPVFFQFSSNFLLWSHCACSSTAVFGIPAVLVYFSLKKTKALENFFHNSGSVLCAGKMLLLLIKANCRHIDWPVIPISRHVLVWQNITLASLLSISSTLRIPQRQKPTCAKVLWSQQ